MYFRLEEEKFLPVYSQWQAYLTNLLLILGTFPVGLCLSGFNFSYLPAAGRREIASERSENERKYSPTGVNE